MGMIENIILLSDYLVIGDFMRNEDNAIYIKDYKIHEIIGDGGFSEVVKCENSHGEFFAMKKPNLDEVVDYKRFKREIRMSKTLHHENIMPICDVNLEDKPYFFTMPIGEMHLEEFLSYDNDETTLVNVIKYVAIGLKHAHDKNIIHRDLKPQNIIIFESDETIIPKICDFGAGRFSMRDTTILTATRESIYSAEYCAPEQRDEFRELDGRADIYSLGKIIYRILTGNHPLDYDLSDVPPNYSYIVSKACQRDPNDRYQDLSELINDLNLIPTLLGENHSKLIEDEIKRIESYGNYSKNSIGYLAMILSIIVDDDALDELPNLPDEILRSLLTNYSELFHETLKNFVDRTMDVYIITNEYVDKVSEFFIKISKSNASTDIKCLILETSAKLTEKTGQYSAVSAFTNIVLNNYKNSEIMKLAKKILESSDNRSFLEQFFKDDHESMRILKKI